MAMIKIGNIRGKQGLQGNPGTGFPVGGLAGQVLTKLSDENYDTAWMPESKTMIIEAFGELATGEIKGFIPAISNMEITGVKLVVLTAPTGDDLIVDINKNGTTIYTTQANRPIILDGDSSAIADLPDVVSISEDDMITIDIDQVGSTVPGSNLAVVIQYDVISEEFAPL